VFVAALGLAGCRDQAPPAAAAKRGAPAPASPVAAEPPAADETETEPPATVDVHVHLVDGQVEALLETLDRHAIARAVVLSSPHLDARLASDRSTAARFAAGWREANDTLLRETAAHRERLLPFVTLDLADASAAELDAWVDAGACGVKLYSGHHSLHPRPLADPAHATMLAELERRGLPVLLHVNTVRFEAELAALLDAYPELDLVCPHLCSSRTELDRLERIMAAHPGLRFDLSHGPGQPGVDGFVNLERERERLRELIAAAPERFMYGSDLVTTPHIAGPDATMWEWDLQVAANLGLITAEQFEFPRPGPTPGSRVPGHYRGLALSDPLASQILAANATAWLSACIESKPP